jgi:hypothetical protein
VCKEMLSDDLKSCDFVCNELHGFGSAGRYDEVCEEPKGLVIILGHKRVFHQKPIHL